MTIFEEIAELKPNWDGYGALHINADAIRRAEALFRVLRHTPAVVPNNNGTVTLEWHEEGFDVEIEVGKTRATLYFEPSV